MTAIDFATMHVADIIGALKRQHEWEKEKPRCRACGREILMTDKAYGKRNPMCRVCRSKYGSEAQKGKRKAAQKKASLTEAAAGDA